MLLARFVPVGSQRYKKLSKSVKSLDKIVEWLPAQLFGIWSIFVAGMAAGKRQSDRFYFWDWSDWMIGVWWEWLIKYIIPIVLGTLFVWSLIDEFTKEEGFLVSTETGKPIWPNIVGLTLMFIVLAAAVILSRVGRTDYRINEVSEDA